MADYAHTSRPLTGLNWQPPVPDTSFGPIIGTYVPRFDAHQRNGMAFGANMGIGMMPPQPPPFVGLPACLPYVQAFVPQAVLQPMVMAPAVPVVPFVPVSPGCCGPSTFAAPMIATFGHKDEGATAWPAQPYHNNQALCGYGPYTANFNINPTYPVFAQQPYQHQSIPMGAVGAAPPFGGGALPGMMPGMVPPQPAVMPGNGAPFPGVGGAPPGNGGPGMPFVGGGVGANLGFHPEPATGIGLTKSEVLHEAMMNSELNQPQEAKPADDDPGRFYWCRQLDGEYIQMPRYAIDSLASRWYIRPDGVFYAVRLPD